MIEAPRLLFPFARALISDATRDGGFMPLNIQPVDFDGEFWKKGDIFLVPD